MVTCVSQILRILKASKQLLAGKAAKYETSETPLQPISFKLDRLSSDS